jgi:tight adherence protein C
MTPVWFAPAVAAGFMMISVLAVALWHDMRQAERLSRRLAMVRLASGPVTRESADPLPAPLRVVTTIGELIAGSGALSSRTLDDLRDTLRIAGFRGENGLGLFVGTKLLLIAGLPLAVLAIPWVLGYDPPHRGAIMAAAGAVGLLLPDKVVQHLRKRYLRALDAGMPDALDMLVICGQAGLGMEASIERVGEEIRHAHVAVADELSRTAHEMQVNADTRTALVNLGLRTGLDSARRLAAVLIQSMQYGTPLNQALRTLSAEQRQEMLANFEAKAGRLPVLLTLPMIVFILPCVFLVVAGPAMVDVYRTMGK